MIRCLTKLLDRVQEIVKPFGNQNGFDWRGGEIELVIHRSHTLEHDIVSRFTELAVTRHPTEF